MRVCTFVLIQILTGICRRKPVVGHTNGYYREASQCAQRPVGTRRGITRTAADLASRVIFPLRGVVGQFCKSIFVDGDSDTPYFAQPRMVLLMAALLALLLVYCPAHAQFGDESAQADGTGGVRLGETRTTRWKVGMIIRAEGGPCKGLSGTVPVPSDWPEQQVRIVEEDISPSVKQVRYRMLSGGVKQMVVQVPTLAAGETAKALVTFEIDRHSILAPEGTEGYQIPAQIPRDLRTYVAPSPSIEVRHPKIVSLAKELRSDELSAWAQVEAIYDYVRDNVQYKNGKLKGAVAALRDGTGDCEELTSLFIALCRANKIPARTVWVPGHCYPEFYLTDAAGAGHWFPCQAAGSRDFGSMPDQRPILQKGDNFKVPERRERQRYVAEFLTGNTRRGGGKPNVQFVREIVTVN